MAEKLAFPRTVRFGSADMEYARLEAHRLGIRLDPMIRTLFAKGVEAHKQAKQGQPPAEVVELPVGDYAQAQAQPRNPLDYRPLPEHHKVADPDKPGVDKVIVDKLTGTETVVLAHAKGLPEDKIRELHQRPTTNTGVTITEPVEVTEEDQ